MAHLIYLRYAPSMIQGENLIHGTHEQLEKAINDRKYSLKLEREGYCQPFSSEWKLLDIRIKKEVLPEFARDLRARNWNPVNNKISLWQVITNKKGNIFSVGRKEKFILWIVKWLNILKLHPLKPCPIAEGQPNYFNTDLFYYHIILGTLPDETKPLTGGGIHEDTL